MNKYLILLLIVVICVILGVLTQTDKDIRQQTFIEEFNRSQEPKQPSQNYQYDRATNKIVPMTVLSPEDAKRPCNDCHDK